MINEQHIIAFNISLRIIAAMLMILVILPVVHKESQHSSRYQRISRLLLYFDSFFIASILGAILGSVCRLNGVCGGNDWLVTTGAFIHSVATLCAAITWCLLYERRHQQ